MSWLVWGMASFLNYRDSGKYEDQVDVSSLFIYDDNRYVYVRHLEIFSRKNRFIKNHEHDLFHFL